MCLIRAAVVVQTPQNILDIMGCWVGWGKEPWLSGYYFAQIRMGG